MSFENINGVSGNASGVPSSTSESFADMLKNVRLNGPTPLTSGGLNVPPPDGRGAVSSAPEAGLMPVTLRRPANAGGVGNEPGTAAHAASAGSSPYSSYLPPIKTQDNQGKTLPQYRMGTGQRILGTLANFASGFAGHGGSPVYVGPGALNNRYYRDEADREHQNQIAAQQNADHFRNEIDYRTIVEEPGTA